MSLKLARKYQHKTKGPESCPKKLKEAILTKNWESVDDKRRRETVFVGFAKLKKENKSPRETIDQKRGETVDPKRGRKWRS